MRKLFLYVVPAIIMGLSIFVMTSGNILKQSFNEKDKLYETIEGIEYNIRNNEWEKARKKAIYAEEAWHVVLNRIQFSVERELINNMGELLSRLRGCVEASDAKGAIQEIYYFYALWDDLGR